MKTTYNDFYAVPVVILCGGTGVIANEKASKKINKALVKIENTPLFILNIMHYARFGARNFILAIGLDFEHFNTCLLEAGGHCTETSKHTYQITFYNAMCTVQFVPTHIHATTAERLFACKAFLDRHAHFAMTYSDTLSDINLADELAFHKKENLIATLASVNMPVRFRVLGLRSGEYLIRGFSPRPVIDTSYINGGYYIFSQNIWMEAYGLHEKSDALENMTLESLAKTQQLAAFEHTSYWQNYDNERDLTLLTQARKCGVI